MKTKTFIVVIALTAALLPSVVSARTHVSVGIGIGGPVYYGGYGYGGPYHRGYYHHYYRPYYAPVYFPPPPVVAYPPVVAAPPVVYQEPLTTYVNVANSNGSITPVKIRRIGTVYVGPRGEQYFSYPTSEQLRSVYGF